MPDAIDYRTLDPDRLVASLDQLERRIRERFPGANLARVCAELGAIAKASRERAVQIERPNLPLRIVVVLLLAACAWLLAKVAVYVDFTKTSADNIYTVLQGIEAAMNIVVLMAAAVWGLFTLEDRIKRRRAIAALHELRSIVHVIDMHQLTKDPALTSAGHTNDTPSSPVRSLTPFELSRYLDYCSEMLSLTAKVAAVYAQSMPDQVVNVAANELEQVATNLSQKVWQKITIVQAMIAATPTTSVPVVPVVGTRTPRHGDGAAAAPSGDTAAPAAGGAKPPLA